MISNVSQAMEEERLTKLLFKSSVFFWTVIFNHEKYNCEIYLIMRNYIPMQKTLASFIEEKQQGRVSQIFWLVSPTNESTNAP